MAITINQEPTAGMQGAYYPLLSAVSSDRSGSPQFQYVMDVYVSGSATRAARIRQYPNPEGDAVFNPSAIFQDYVKYDDNAFNAGSTATNGNVFKTNEAVDGVVYLQCKFGEEYGTSASSSVNLRTGIGDNIGDPAKEGVVNDVHSAQFDPRNATNGYNFDTSAYSTKQIFTNYPNSTVSPISYPGEDCRKLGYYDMAALQAIFDPGALTFTRSTFNSAGVPLSTSSESDGQTSTRNKMGTGGIQRTDLTPTQWNSVKYIRFDAGDINKAAWFKKDEDECINRYDRVTLNFINRLGCWDFFGFNLPTKQTSRVSRDTYKSTFINYSGTTSPYARQNRGEQVYSVSKMDNVTVTTPYLSQGEAQFLEQIYDSPNVFLSITNQFNGNFIQPVIVTDGQFDRNVNKRGQKLFQYSISMNYANNLTGR
tara:strand:- start:2325 stop:3596 length:1272 start_codon:yes stop_codon:yes gene_type:complete